MDLGLDGYGLTVKLRRIGTTLLLWAFPLSFLAVFFFWPLYEILRVSLGQVLQELDLPQLRTLWSALRFTIIQAVLSTVLTLGVGLPAAYLFARYSFPGKRLLRALTTVPFILPTVVVAASFNALTGPRGWLNLALMALLGLSEPPIQLLNTLWAILLAHVFYNSSIVIRVVGNAWEALDPRLNQAARVLGANRWTAFWEITLPLLRPFILAAAVLIFLFDFTSFGVILLLGGPRFATLEVEIYIQAMQMLNLPAAGVLSLIQLACTLALTVWYSRLSGRLMIPSAPGRDQGGNHRPQGFRERMVVSFLITGLVILLVTPLLALTARSFVQLEANRSERGQVQTGLTLQYYRELSINRQQSYFYVAPIEAAKNSLQYAGITLAITLPLGLLAAYALNRPVRINRLLDPLLMLPLGTSAVTLGLGFLLVFNQPPLDPRSSPWLVPVAHSLVALPFVVRALLPAIGSIPDRLHQAAAVLGAAGWRIWLEIDLPILSRAVLGSAIFAFAISMGEFGATTFLAQPDYPTLPVAIYRFLSQPGALNYGQAMAMATILMAVSTAAILVIEGFHLPGGSS